MIGLKNSGQLFDYSRYNGKGVYEFCLKNSKNIALKYTDNFSADYCLSTDNCSKYNKNEYVTAGCHGGGRGGLQDYKSTSLNIESIKDDEIHYVATSEYCGGSFCHETKDTVKTIKKDFVIKKVGNEWKINSFYLPN